MIALLLVILSCRAELRDLDVLATFADGAEEAGWVMEPDFDKDTLSYNFYVPLETQSVGFKANVTNDRIWLRVYDENDNFVDDTSMYSYSDPMAVVEGWNLFKCQEEEDLINDPIYLLNVLVAVITTKNPTTSPTSLPTLSPSLSPTPSPTDSPIALETTAEPTASTTTTTAEPTASTTTTTAEPTASTTNEAGTTSVALPEQSPDVSVCDENFISNVWVQLIAQEEGNTGTNFCADLTVDAQAGQELTFDEMCLCFTAADQDYLETINCRPNDPTLYTFSDVSNWCYGEEQILEGPTDTIIVFDKILEDFDTSTWSGTDDQYVYPGQKLRQTFTGNDLDQPDENSNYILVEFDASAFGEWEEGDAITVEFDYTEVYRYEIAGSFGTDGEDSTHSFIVPLDPYTTTVGDAHTFTLGYTSNLAGNDEYFEITPTKLETFTREDLSVYCRPTHSNNASVNHPVFEQGTSGFIWNYEGATMDSIRLHLEASIPRYIYDFTIDFDNGDGLSGFAENREFVSLVQSLDETYWTSDLLTAENIVDSTKINCGSEIWEADIPWNVFNEEGSGGVSQITHYNDGTGEQSDTDYYLFGSTARFEATEPIFVSEGGRDWYTTRDSIWRVPFLVRFQRIVYVESDLEVHLCPDEETNRALCTLTAVAALVEHIQANTVYDTTTQDYRADVNLRIATKVFYPYMFITGTKDDDPPTYWETYSQVDPYYQPPLDSGAWSPPSVVYEPAGFAAGTQVEATMSFLSEVEPDCTFNNENDINLNLGRECPQYWNMYIKPLNGACYIDGTYTVTWAARCFYNKPVCWFNDDANGNRLNTVEVVFQVHSTNMCPELVHDVDVYGVLCPTGRYDYYRCAEADGANTEDIYTYFQNDEVYFFLETESESARIIYSRILEIWVEQDYSSYDGSVTPLDSNWDGLNKLWDVTTDPNDLVFVSSVSGATETVPNIMLETPDSNHFAQSGHSFSDTQGTGDLDLGNYAGFKVKLDSRIFPVPSDSFTDVTFRTKVEIWYEGFGDNKPVRRRLAEDDNEREYEINGKETIWYNTHVSMNKQIPTFLPCFDETMDSFWAYKMILSEEQKTKYDGSLDSVLNDEMYRLLETNDVSLLGFTESEDSLTAIYSADNQHWTSMQEIFGTSNFGKDGLFWWSADVSDVYCLDAPLGTSVSSLSSCANGKACSFLDGQLLADYTGPESTIIQPSDSSAQALGIMSLFALLVILF